MRSPLVFFSLAFLAHVPNVHGQVAENEQSPAVASSLPTSPILNPELAPLSATADPGELVQDGQAPPGAGGQEKLAALEGAVTELANKLTVVTADDDFKLILGGTITADFLYNSA